MDVFSLSVRFQRKVQVKDYEPVEGEVTLSANVHPGDDFALAAATLMNTARQTVIDGLRGSPAPNGTTTTSTTALNSGSNGAVPAADAKPTETASSDAPRGRGRPPKTEEEKAAEAAAKTAAKKAAETKPAASDIPEEPKSNGAAAPAKLAATTAASDIPEEPKSNGAAAPASNGAATMTADDLQSYITKQVQSKKVSVEKIKGILAQHGVARTSEIPAGDLQTVKDEIEMAALA